MRLTAVKLAGFKSFVDPTTFYAPTNLTGIVGPNGCGKSNIIDAVRWVMGEGSPHVLRGESMADVIFSGSSGRKPVGTATVELLFDNSDGRIGGQFAGYNEISVKRQVSRDGVSIYFLNGTRCRRRDVREVFLGTGIGSRSYSIIEQGMISEVVDARPEDIRGHLEEAAGISKYKERRRETESRIQHTRDNLARLSDLREEVSKHLGRLQRQAAAANRYRKLKQEKRDLDSRLLTWRWRDLRAQVEKGLQALSRTETALQETVAGQRAAEAVLEKIHQQQAQSGENFSAVQGELYAVSGEIARLEQAIAYARELQARQKEEFAETSAALGDLEKHLLLDRVQVEALTQALAEVEPALQQAGAAENLTAEALVGVEADVQAWQTAFEQHNQKNNECLREADLTRAEVTNLEQRMVQSSHRIELLDKETATVDTAALAADLVKQQQLAEELRVAEQTRQQELDDLRGEFVRGQAALRAHEALAQGKQRDLHTREGRLESLLALQSAALAAAQNERWLQDNGLDQAPRLARLVKAAKGWEVPLEVVLGDWLQSVVANGNESRLEALAGIRDTSMDLLDAASGAVKPVKGTLAEKVKAPDVVLGWLNRIRVASSLQQAWEGREQLRAGESFITVAGEWLGQGWIRIGRGVAGEEGMLSRENAIAELQQEVTRLDSEVRELLSATLQQREKLTALEQTIQQAQTGVNATSRRHSEVQSQLDSHRTSMQMMDERQRAIAAELAELRQQLDQDQQAIRAARTRLQGLLERLSVFKQERDQLDLERGQLLARRDLARSALKQAREQRHELALKAEARRASLESLRQSLQRTDSQISQLQQRHVTLTEQMARTAQPEQTHAAEMNDLLQRRVETEARMGQAREGLQQLEQQYREQDAARQKSLQLADEIRQQLERSRLQQQEVELSARAIERQVESLGGDINALLEGLPEDAEAALWEEELERLAERITRLEPVNLAAIDEFEEEKKRKEYLDAQNADLCEALTTLEEAIAKIDRKTRTIFKDTFEKVNQGVQELFPRLFGGGHAYLELTGDDMLTTGVSIMARPPGKRVSNIHLLSGGEKALTAVAFVFAIFQLNPAPFCLLDEVDAPLDDANVARFSAMVRELSETVQFIFVSHNKITMEMAHQLSGVTMREPGVSRLVQVDIDEAARLVAI